MSRLWALNNALSGLFRLDVLRNTGLVKVYVSSEGDLVALGNLTFYDELTARVFDAFLDAFAQIVKKHVLTEEARKMLK